MPSKQAIAELAYHLWNARGRPDNSEEEDWLDAERQLAAADESSRDAARPPGRAMDRREESLDAALEDTFPASDPIASHLPDIPPSNGKDERLRNAKRAPGSPSVPVKAAKRRGSSGAASTSQEFGDPPVDETDDAPTTAPHDIGEG
jgi:hypothetical protein